MSARSHTRTAALMGLSLSLLLAGCTTLEDRLDAVAPQYRALPSHKALVFNTDTERLAWVSGKGSQLDAIQLAEILCTRASMDPNECRLVDVDGHKLYDPVEDRAYPPDTPELADALYETGIPTKLPQPPQTENSSCFLGLFC
ncbi:MAG TPA: hypothetical protein VKZ79_04635 [Alphaproteobacteria bacterium]|nr:hypothetical protein [Alphaproteobacteria bacterium]